MTDNGPRRNHETRLRPGSTPMHTEVQHPLIQHKLTILRDSATDRKLFRELACEITMLLAYEALKRVPLKPRPVMTPLAECAGEEVAADIVVVPVLRAGMGMLDGILKLIPTARVGFIGLYRDPETKQPVAYYEKLPPAEEPAIAIVIDPMLATGGSLVSAIDMLKRSGYHDLVIISILAAPEGMAVVESAHPDVAIYTGAIDDHLDAHKYIIPGLGDAGDRLFGTQ